MRTVIICDWCVCVCGGGGGGAPPQHSKPSYAYDEVALKAKMGENKHIFKLREIKHTIKNGNKRLKNVNERCVFRHYRIVLVRSDYTRIIVRCSSAVCLF